jgi:hypothetical protein
VEVIFPNDHFDRYFISFFNCLKYNSWKIKSFTYFRFLKIVRKKKKKIFFMINFRITRLKIYNA